MAPWSSRDDESGIAYLRFRSPDQWSEVAQSEHVELADGPDWSSTSVLAARVPDAI